ncbi:LOW QUALITY PROTEIN: putative disease resistance protein At1g50180 [Pyrus x bretschneideri]|uniref:LOW QUALITY PROTEIN: putative disease resistance protein At1g50180 n=1 Tax=Pyrus x bretschneideri TaxID=225117 RepID=UPI00202DCBEC|nr:LOW QUALITY PROTEIN: putative disease resistance protein At1g50180 [Pyrus x bretschneideri]
MAEAVVSFVVERLGDLIIQEAKFLIGVSDQVEAARTELQLVQGFLKDADVRQRDDETVHILVAKIRNAAYDLEDVIEIFVLQVASKREGGIMKVLKRFGCVLKEGVDLHKIGSEIEKITTQVSNFRSSLQTHNIMEIRDPRGATSLYERRQQLRRSYSHIIDRDVVGLEADVRELVMQLVKKEPRHQVVSIWGMGGIGKTTLAKQIYRHDEVRRHFGSFVWVCISQQCQVRDVWEQLLIRLLSATTVQREEIAKMTDYEIAKRIYLLQQESRCLVVIDDIWSIETWETLKAAFPLNQRTESRILLTTRVKEVALHAADRNGILHQPRPLNEDESWELLEKIAIFGREEITPEVFGKMKEIGKKMLQHCAGLPLAVIVLAGLLARKDTIEEWDTVLNNVYAYIRRGKGHEQECMGTLWVLSLSYDNLPYHLKSCFLYLGIFPEDFEIPVKRLTQLWGRRFYIYATTTRTRFSRNDGEIAYNYLNELVDRCVVQIGERGSVRKIKSCRLHDLMRDLCLIKSEEEGFLQNVRSLHRSETMYSPPSLMIAKAIPTGKVRRLAICLDENVDKLVPSSYERDDRLRSLLYFCPLDWYPKNEKLVSSLFKDFKLLRVLKIEGMTALVYLPNEIGNMVHLRFLSLRYSHIKRLPSSLGNLILLQTLDLRIHNDPDMLPNVFWKMVQLRHLYLPLYYTARGNTLHLSTLHNLQTLNYVSSRCCELNDLAGLTSLRKLVIELASPLKNLEETLKGISSTLNGIRSLFVHNLLGTDSGPEVTQIVLSCRHVYKLQLIGRTVELPGDLQHFPNLTKLSLRRCDLNHNQMAVLAKLPNLKILCLMEETFESSISDTLVFSNEGFRHLECLSLSFMYELKDLKVERGAMPSLRRLFIKGCYRLTEVPNGLRYLTTLRELGFVAMSTTFRNRLQVGGEDFDKVQHVPSVVFADMRDSSEIAKILSRRRHLSAQGSRGKNLARSIYG